MRGRPATTYRAARRNEWRMYRGPWVAMVVRHGNVMRARDAVKERPYQSRGWDWRNGNSAVRRRMMERHPKGAMWW